MKYPLLDNVEYLQQAYLIDKRSTFEITKSVGCKSPNTVRQRLLKYSIEPRSITDHVAQNSPKYTINRDVVDGSLMGDGGLRTSNKNSKSTVPYFYKKNKYLDHVEYVANYFSNDISSLVSSTTDKCRDKTFKYYVIRTRATPTLAEYYRRWYVDGVKTIPTDIEITPLFLLNWFMDDGSSYSRRRSSNKKQIIITLSCECFDKSSIDMMVDKLEYFTGLPFKTVKCNSGKGYRIQLSQRWSDAFFQYIGECPVKSLAYKWK